MMKVFFTILLLQFSMLDSEAQWIQQNSGTNQNLYDIEFINEKTGWAVGDAGVVIKTTNGGINWNNIPNPSGQYGGLMWSIHPVDSEFVYAVAGYDFIMKSTNSGNNWIILNSCNQCNSAITGLYFLNRDTGWFLGTNKVFRTYDGGNTLDSFYAPWFTNFDIYFKDINTGFFCGTGRVFKSTNGGENWIDTNIPVGGSFPFFRKMANYNNNIWVGGGGRIYYSSNFGSEWIISDSSLGAFGITFINEYTGYLGGGSNKLFKTTNSGFNWYQQRTDSSSLAFISSIDFVNDTTGWYSCGVGRIYKTTSGGQWLTNVNTFSNQLPQKFKLYQNYPNPFNNQTIINFDIIENNYYKLEIYNLLGQKLDLIFNQSFQTGSYSIKYDSQFLSTGIYVFKLSSDESAESKILTIIK